MKRKGIVIFVILIISLNLLFLNACSLIEEKEAYRNDYYAKLIEQPSTMKANFISNNKIKCTEPYDDSRPSQRFFVIDTKEKYQEIFDGDCPMTFVNKFLLVVTCAETDNMGKLSVQHCVLENNTLIVRLKKTLPKEMKNKGYAKPPYQGWYFIQMNRVEFEQLTFITHGGVEYV